jgi:ABC-type antimicrobial peptide transport system permease subunit
MNMFEIIRLSCKYLFRYRRRYLFLFFALSFGFGIVTAITAIKASMTQNVYDAAQSHYAGDVIVMGWEAGSNVRYHLDKQSVDTVFQTIDESGIGVKHIVQRNLYSHGIIFFNGVSVDLKYLVGVDWENEKSYFDDLNYAAGSNRDLDDKSIIISNPIAKALGAQAGDSIILEIENKWGQKDTAVFILAATVDDTSIFGFYKAFIPLGTMNRLIGFETGESGLAGIYLKNQNDVGKANETLQKLFSSKIQTAGLMRNRAEFESESEADWKGIRIFVMTIPIYLSGVAQVLDALNILIAFLYVMLLVIILVSAGVTYRLILHERIKEVGTMRSIGFYERDVRNVLLCEALLLGVVSIIAGFILALLFTRLAGILPVDRFPGFEIFLKTGRLGAVFSSFEMTLNIAAIYIVLLIAVWFPAFNSSRAPLTEMLSGGAIGAFHPALLSDNAVTVRAGTGE